MKDYIFDITTDKLILKGSKLSRLKVVIDDNECDINYNIKDQYL